MDLCPSCDVEGYLHGTVQNPPCFLRVLRASVVTGAKREGWRRLVSPVGIEPTTNWLKANCSTTELRARVSTRLTRSERPRRVVTIRTGRSAVNHAFGERFGPETYCRDAPLRW